MARPILPSICIASGCNDGRFGKFGLIIAFLIQSYKMSTAAIKGCNPRERYAAVQHVQTATAGPEY